METGGTATSRGRVLLTVVLALATIGIVVPSAISSAAPADSPHGGEGNNSGGPGQSAAVQERVIVNVRAGGDRVNAIGSDSISNLQGAQFAAYEGTNYATITNGTPLAWCTTNATGYCHLNLTPRPSGGYVVRQVAAASGRFVQTAMTTTTGSTGATAEERPYQFYTPAVSGQTYAVPNSSGSNNASNTYMAGTNQWASPRVNPELERTCGIKVGLLVDLSSSVAGVSGADEDIQTALTGFVNALDGTGSSLAIHTFGTFTPVPNGNGNDNSNLGLTPVANQTTLEAKANAIGTIGGSQWTNWDRGIYGLSQTANPAFADLDLLMVLTDGMPTRYGGTNQDGGLGNTQGPSSVFTRYLEVEHAIASANALKAQGTRIMAVAIGEGLQYDEVVPNLQAISGPNVDDDYFVVESYSDLNVFLQDRADAACSGTVSVAKRVVPVGGTYDPNSVEQLAGGWSVTAASPNGEQYVRPDGNAGPWLETSTLTTANDTGSVGFQVRFEPGNLGAKTITFTEQQQPEHQLTQFDGKNARCWTIDDDDARIYLDVTNAGDAADPGFSVTVADGQSVRCEFVNQALANDATVRVDKIWKIDGNGDGDYDDVEYDFVGQPNEVPTESTWLSSWSQAGLSITDRGQSVGTTWGQTYTVGHNADLSIVETVPPMPALCRRTGTTWSADPATLSALDPATDLGRMFHATRPRDQGTNVVTITNEVACETRLTLVKDVGGGTATDDMWRLTAHRVPPAATALPGPSGPGDAADELAVTAAVTPDQLYALAEQGLDVPLTSTYTQDWTPTLQAQWEERHPPATGSWVCVNASSATWNGQTWANPQFGTTQVDGRNGGAVVAVGGWMKCTATNRLNPTIELVKLVDDAGVVSTTGADQWQLGVTWEPPASWVGATQSWTPPSPLPAGWPYPATQPPVLGQGGFAATSVLPGVYTLSESNAPAGYENATTWSCTIDDGDPLLIDADDGYKLTLLEGQDARCEIVNTKLSTDVGIVKTASGVPGGSLANGEQFTYTLTVTNHGAAIATDVVVVDEVPTRLRVDDVAVPTGWTDASAGNAVEVTVPTLAPGATAQIVLTVTLLPAAVPAPVDIQDGEPAPPLPALAIESILNEACVEAAADSNPANNCDDVSVPVDDIVAVVYVRCINDAPLLGYSVQTTPSLANEPITLTWRPNSPTPQTSPQQIVLELQSGDADEIAWPGAVFTSGRVSIDWPGWRPIAESDYVDGSLSHHPAANIFNGMILDTTELDYAWRVGTTVTFSVNPTITFTAGYPDTTPECAPQRSAELEIEKVASVASINAGQAFNYSLDVTNVAADGAAEPVILTDPIPPEIRVDSIVTSTTAFPRWTNCAVTGKDSAGYGGELRCDLFGALPMGASAPQVRLNVTTRPSAVGTVTNTAVVSWQLASDPDSPVQFADDAASITVNAVSVLPPVPPTTAPAPLPPTGSSSTQPLIRMAFATLLGGVVIVLVTRRRKHAVSE